MIYPDSAINYRIEKRESNIWCLKPDDEGTPTRGRDLTSRIREFASQFPGKFTVTQLDTELGIDMKARSGREKAIQRLVEAGYLKRVARGTYKKTEIDLEIMDWKNTDPDDIVDIKLPFGLESHVNIYPKNIIIIAGSTNGGKTALILNFIRDNMHKFPIYYFTNELSEQELRVRIDMFGEGVDWPFYPIERGGDYEDVIVPEAINIIDYLDAPDSEYYKMAALISSVHRQLTTGIAIIAIQKNRGAQHKWGVGGQKTAEKSRLYIALDENRAEVVKAKSPKKGKNINGQVIEHRIDKGGFITDIIWK